MLSAITLQTVCHFFAWYKQCCTANCLSPDKRIGFYLEARVSSGYYSAKDIAMDFVNVVHNKCIPRGNLSSCVSKVQNQGCENQFASAACPGRHHAIGIMSTT